MKGASQKYRLHQFTLLIVLLAATLASFAYLRVNLADLWRAEALAGMADYGKRLLQPDLSAPHLRSIGQATLETLCISLVSTLFAAVLGIAFALPAAGRFGTPLKIICRFLLNALRSVPELVWAALMVLAAGLGPNAGTLALALHTTGVLGRLFSEAFENTPHTPEQALILAGSRRVAAFFYGTLPLAWPQLIAYSLYRWENNIRMAAILGFVGAGGLGQMLYIHLSLFQEPQAATVILAMLLLVAGVDSMSAWIRGRWVRA